MSLPLSVLRKRQADFREFSMCRSAAPGFKCRVDRIKKRLDGTAAQRFLSDYYEEATERRKSAKEKGKEKARETEEIVIDSDDDEEFVAPSTSSLLFCLLTLPRRH